MVPAPRSLNQTHALAIRRWLPETLALLSYFSVIGLDLALLNYILVFMFLVFGTIELDPGIIESDPWHY